MESGEKREVLEDEFEHLAITENESSTDFTTKSSTEGWTEICRTNLIAGKFQDAGDVIISVSDDGNDIMVTYMMENNWCVKKTHLDVATEYEDLPFNKAGQPKFGHFAYKGTLPGCESEWSQIIPLASIEGYDDPNFDGFLLFAAHARVRQLEGSNGKMKQAWGEGYDVPGKGWAMYFGCQLPCKESVLLATVNNVPGPGAISLVARINEIRKDGQVTQISNIEESVNAHTTNFNGHA